MYALNIVKETSRILSACVVLPQGSYTGMPVVDTIPEGNIPDYRYENNEYIYDPLPEPEPEESVPSDSERINVLEKQMNALMGGVADVQ